MSLFWANRLCLWRFRLARSLSWCFLGNPFRVRICVTCGLVPFVLYGACVSSTSCPYVHVSQPYCYFWYYYQWACSFFWANYLCLGRFRLARSRGVFGESPFDYGFVSRVVWCPCIVRCVLITDLYLCIWQIPNTYFHYTFMYGCLFVCFSFFFFFFARFFWFMYVFFSPFKCECPGGVGVACRINMSWFCLGTVRVLVDSFFFSFFSASLFFFLSFFYI